MSVYNNSVLADFNLYFLLASRVRESALSRYQFSLIHRRLFVILYIYIYSNVNSFIFLVFSKDDRSRSLSICDTLVITIVTLNKTCSPTLDASTISSW